MIISLAIGCCVAGVLGLAPRQSTFAAQFADSTMRLDYFHTGGRGTEIIALDRIVSDGRWAGSRTRLLDDTELGKYRVLVRDSATGSLLYSRGFASLYGEWETTPEAATGHRTFHGSLRFPWPRAAVSVQIEKRDSLNVFQPLATIPVNPAAHIVNAAEPRPPFPALTLLENGPASRKVDIVVLGEGYTAAEAAKFRADARKFVDNLFAVEPFRSRKRDFNVRAVMVPSAQSGIFRPHAGRFRRTPLSTQYGIFDSERYVLTEDNRALREALSGIPYEFVEILVNEKQYGGGGIFNDHATAATGSEFTGYLEVHEFAHHFAALADEYYTSPVAYQTGGSEHIEPWEPNVTALHDTARLKWKDLLKPGTPLPTPWDKARYEEHSRAFQARRRELIARNAPEAEFDALFREQRVAETRLLGSMEYSKTVGAFEGAAYEAVGLYRPETDCIMFSRDDVGFCAVCRRAIERIIDLYAG